MNFSSTLVPPFTASELTDITNTWLSHYANSPVALADLLANPQPVTTGLRSMEAITKLPAYAAFKKEVKQRGYFISFDADNPDGMVALTFKRL